MLNKTHKICDETGAVSTPKKNQPLVSCIMPTANRPCFVPGAIGCFIRQTYPHKELIIVDDGVTSVACLIPNDPCIHYLRLKGKQTIGAKRNIACSQAQGKIIAHFDDDDWSASWRLEYQVQQLTEENADVCGLNRVYFFDPKQAQAWEYRYPPNQRPWVAGGTLVYTNAFWQGHPFRDDNIGEDAWFVWDLPMPRLKVLLNNRFFVACIHPKNTSPKHTRSERWRQRSVSRIVSIMGEVWPQEKHPTMHQPEMADKEARHSEVNNASGKKLPPLVAVSIPYFGCRSLLRRAVKSILEQTYTRLVLVVVNDGDHPPWEVLADIDDPRLHRFDLARNHGRYFADAVVLNAVDADYFLIQDADDWSEPGRLAVLVAQIQKTDALGAISPNWVHRSGKGTGLIEQPKNLGNPLTRKLEHRFNHFGLFSRDGLQSIGGYYGGFCIGYDTLLMAFLEMVGTIVCADQPLYHRTMRKGSLTSAPATGHGSQTRALVRQRLQHLYEEAFGQYQLYCRNKIGREKLCREITRISGLQIPLREKAALETASAQLRDLLIQQPETTGPARVFVLDDELLSSNFGWAMDEHSLGVLRARLLHRQPRRILEAGSGISTLVLADYCARHGGTLMSLEHDVQQYRHTREMLEEFGLDPVVDLVLARIRQFDSPIGQRFYWYDAVLDGKFDYILVDGPPMKYGREAAFFWVQPHLGASWELLLHDGLRSHESDCVGLWKKYFPALKVDLDPAGKGNFLISGSCESDFAGTREALHRVGITLLTGGRPHLLKNTIAALQAACGHILELCRVCVLINGRDPETRAYVKRLPFVDRIIQNTQGILPIGTATSLLMQEIVTFNGIHTILHLEDDWGMDSPDPRWLFQGLTILKHHPGVGQVRLRHCDEKVLPYHMVTRRPIIWQRQCGFLIADAAHFTFNPFLMRAVDLPMVFPCTSEEEAQQKFLSTGMATVQLVKGAFCHLGDQSSLRMELGR